jgi:hypothetical protein
MSDAPSDPRYAHLFVALGRASDLLPGGKDYLLLILKGQLLVEEQLDRIVRSSVEDATSLPKRISFRMLLSLAMSLRRSRAHDAAWDGAGRLNDYRNRYAHRLEHDVIEDEIDTWTRTALPVLRKAELLAPDETPMNEGTRLRLVILAIYLALNNVNRPGLLGDLKIGMR